MHQENEALTRAKTDQLLLADAKLANALWDFGEFTNNEECRFCAILKAQEVIKMIGQSLSHPGGIEHRSLFETVRDDLQTRMERVALK